MSWPVDKTRYLGEGLKDSGAKTAHFKLRGTTVLDSMRKRRCFGGIKPRKPVLGMTQNKIINLKMITSPFQLTRLQFMTTLYQAWSREAKPLITKCIITDISLKVWIRLLPNVCFLRLTSLSLYCSCSLSLYFSHTHTHTHTHIKQQWSRRGKALTLPLSINVFFSPNSSSLR